MHLRQSAPNLVARKLSCNGVVPEKNVCCGKWSRNLSPSRGLTAGPQSYIAAAQCCQDQGRG